MVQIKTLLTSKESKHLSLFFIKINIGTFLIFFYIEQQVLLYNVHSCVKSGFLIIAHFPVSADKQDLVSKGFTFDPND